MEIATTQDDAARLRGGVLVPTMGALHEGHAALIRRATELGPRPVVVSIFVNQAQFNDTRDFERYPRTADDDLAVSAESGADAVFMPPTSVVYPEPPELDAIPLPDVATTPGLEDAARPGHFAGVWAVCSRLFDLCNPSSAVFGEKDWQQLLVVGELARRRSGTPAIVPAPTVREPDGLAMSSRNTQLDPPARRLASAIPRALHAAAHAGDPAEAEAAARHEIDHPGIALEYLAIRDAQTLGRFRPGRPGRTLVAARIGATRLIDNAPWPAPHAESGFAP